LREGAVVGFASFIGSLVPLAPFFFMNASAAIVPSLAVTAAVLFGAGAYKGRTTAGEWWKAGLEMALIGMGAAVIGYIVGSLAGKVF
jgi:predicted membrane protein (TIGR00267 family)